MEQREMTHGIQTNAKDTPGKLIQRIPASDAREVRNDLMSAIGAGAAEDAGYACHV